MIWRACFDYPDKPCGWWEPGGCDAPAAGGWVVSRDAVPAGCRLVWSVDVCELSAPPVPPDGPLEVRWELRVAGSWRTTAARLSDACLPPTWHLLLEGLVEGENDDVADIAELLSRSRIAGCGFVTLVSPEGSYSYRYRICSLVRYLCDEHRLRFGVLEVHERHNSDYLNRYFASSACCRGLPRPAGKASVKKLGLG